MGHSVCEDELMCPSTLTQSSGPRGIYTNCIGFAKLCFFASLLNAACRLLGVRRLQKLKFGILILDIQLPDKITKIRVCSKRISCLKEKYCQFFLQSSQYFNEVFWLLLLKRQTLNHPNPPEVTQANASVLLFPSSLCLLSLLYSWHSSGGGCAVEQYSVVQKGKGLPPTEVMRDCS